MDIKKETSDAARMSGVRFAYRNEDVLGNVDLTVPFGEVTLLVGENGSGKSTLLSLLLGELEPAAGTIEVLGRSVRDASPADWRKVGYVPQAASSSMRDFPATVAELLRASFLGGRKEARTAVERALAEQGIAGLERHLLRELSGGQMQKVLLARAAINDPRLLLLDEPTSGLDQPSVDAVAAFARQKAASGAGVLMITHDLERIGSHAGGWRRLRLKDGEVHDA